MNRARYGELDELYELQADLYELDNRFKRRPLAPVKQKLQRDLRRLAADALGS